MPLAGEPHDRIAGDDRLLQRGPYRAVVQVDVTPRQGLQSARRAWLAGNTGVSTQFQQFEAFVLRQVRDGQVGFERLLIAQDLRAAIEPDGLLDPPELEGSRRQRHGVAAILVWRDIDHGPVGDDDDVLQQVVVEADAAAAHTSARECDGAGNAHQVLAARIGGAIGGHLHAVAGLHRDAAGQLHRRFVLAGLAFRALHDEGLAVAVAGDGDANHLGGAVGVGQQALVGEHPLLAFAVDAHGAAALGLDHGGRVGARHRRLRLRRGPALHRHADADGEGNADDRQHEPSDPLPPHGFVGLMSASVSSR